MKPQTIKHILDTYENIEEGEPDISTERLIQTTADMAKVSYSNVVDALHFGYDSKGNRK